MQKINPTVELPTQTTTQDVELQEVQDITSLIDEAIFYDGYVPPKIMAKGNQVVGALVQILVAKGLLNKQDVKRILTQAPALTNVQSSEE